jgi:hypothetical protein
MSKKPKKQKESTLTLEAAKPEAAKPAAVKAAPQVAPARPAPAPMAAPAAPISVEAPKPATPAPRVNHVLLELFKPEAKTVYVAGSFNGWKPESTPLTRSGNGRWVGDLAIKPGRYEYLFVVDGQWVPDPNASETVTNPYGGRNSVLIAAG